MYNILYQIIAAMRDVTVGDSVLLDRRWWVRLFGDVAYTG
jgi:hypothetical protein